MLKINGSKMPELAHGFPAWHHWMTAEYNQVKLKRVNQTGNTQVMFLIFYQESQAKNL
jgi:hypothetical protein